MASTELTFGFEPYIGNSQYIFISYSHADIKEIKPIVTKLQGEKFRLWYDANEAMKGGSSWSNHITEKIVNCGAFLFFMSSNSLKSENCLKELLSAFKSDRLIIPVRLSTDDMDIPPIAKIILESKQDIRNVSREANYNNLVASIPVDTRRSLEISNGVITKCRDGSKSIVTPKIVTKIGDSAFASCEKLEEIILNDELEVLGKESFRKCINLKRIVLGPNVKTVGDSSFRDCASLEEVTVENQNIELGERSFEACSSLRKVTLNDGITEIYGGLFNSCKSLCEINFPKELTILGESSFAGCLGLTEIVLPSTLVKIDDMVFNGCCNIKKITLNNYLNKIGKNAFKDCSSLEKIYIPSKVNFIGSGPFRGCSELNEITVDPKNKFFKSVDSVLFNKNKSILICRPSKAVGNSYAIPDSVISISDWAFNECDSLTEIEIPDSVTEIGEGAFHSCRNLKKIIIPDSVTKIDDIAFRSCTNLKEVKIPDSVTEIGWGLFNGCHKDLVVICSKTSIAHEYCENKNIQCKEK